MTGTQFQKTETATTINATGGRLFVLDLSGGRVLFDETRWFGRESDSHRVWPLSRRYRC